MTIEPKTYKLTPTSLTYTYSHCKACFHAIVHGWKEPPKKLPGLFHSIDRCMRAAYDGSDPATWSDLPTGILQTKEKQVVSQEFELLAYSPSKFYFSGRTDGLLYFGDTHGVLDFKTVHRSKDKTDDEFRQGVVELYAPQDYAYAWSLEKPAPGKFHLPHVKHMGFLCSTPKQTYVMGDNDMLEMKRHWIPVPRDDDWFVHFLGGVLQLLDRPRPPFTPGCDNCQSRQNQKIAAYALERNLLPPSLAG